MLELLAATISVLVLGFIFCCLMEIQQALAQGRSLGSSVRHLAGEHIAQKSYDRTFWDLVNASDITFR